MHRIINTTALLVFVWLVLDTLRVQDMLLNFLLAGEIPLTRTALSPSMMIAIMSVATSAVLFELLARRITIIRQRRDYIIGLITKRDWLVKRTTNRT
ncbi:MAG: hypothetical protein H6797_01645 [Candidatus Nomurabacteria bacterium]|nr:MAG: hypothetical protein H6797_01645 [Candidatus Nomurabacteria bacterium]